MFTIRYRDASGMQREVAYSNGSRALSVTKAIGKLYGNADCYENNCLAWCYDSGEIFFIIFRIPI